MSRGTVRDPQLGLDIRLMGPPEIEVHGRPLDVDTRKAVALLAYLSIEKQVVSRQAIAGFLWPEQDKPSARGALRRTLSVLRKAVAGAVTADRDTIRLDPSILDKIDVHRFLHMSQPAEDHGHGAQDVCEKCVPALEQALALLRGDFMEGFTLRACPTFEMWHLQWAERLRLLLDHSLERLSSAYAISNDYWRGVSTTRRRIETNPLNEDAWCELMQLHAWSGNRSAALEVYRECVATLDRDLNVAPLETTTELMEAIAEDDLKPAPSERRGRTQERVAAAADQVVEAAVVVFEPFSVEALRKVSGRSETEVTAALDEMIGNNTLTEGPTGAFSFADQALRARLYRRMPLSRRTRLHGRAADVLLSGTDPRGAVATAKHLENAGRIAEAAEWHRRAAELSQTTHRLDEALAHFDAALSLGSPAHPIHEAMGDIHRLAGRYGDALAAYQRSVGTSATSAVEAKIGALFARIGRFELATHHLLSALEDPDLAGRGRVLVGLGMVGVRQGRPDEARRRADEARQHDADDLGVLAEVENLLGIVANKEHRSEDAVRHLEQASRLAQRVGDKALGASVANNFGLTLAALGRPDAAADSAMRAVGLTVEIGDRHGEAAARNNLADHLRQAGRTDDAIEQVSLGVAIMAEIGVDPEKLDPEIWRLTEW